jgi:death-on-curing protein
MTAEPVFLTFTDVLEIHKDQIENYGGQEGIRDKSLLSSALAMPESTFGGQHLHGDLFEMAAAYAYHICQNH